MNGAPPEPGAEGIWTDGVAVFFPESRAAWRAWLKANHGAVERLWLVLPKKGSGLPGISNDEAVEEALCFGWIDSRPGKVDETRWLLQFTPRKPGSVWSKPNKLRVETLLAAGLMAAPGLAAVERAKRDRSWSALDSSDALELPVDLLRALERDPAAAAGWERFAPSTRKPLLFWVSDAKRAKTRTDRIARIVQGAKAGRSPLAWRGSKEKAESAP
jgi:uncharacterized protein YdeI (YjbR/CyaY-like superfamily)